MATGNIEPVSTSQPVRHSFQALQPTLLWNLSSWLVPCSLTPVIYPFIWSLCIPVTFGQLAWFARTLHLGTSSSINPSQQPICSLKSQSPGFCSCCRGIVPYVMYFPASVPVYVLPPILPSFSKSNPKASALFQVWCPWGGGFWYSIISVLCSFLLLYSEVKVNHFMPLPAQNSLVSFLFYWK